MRNVLSLKLHPGNRICLQAMTENPSSNASLGGVMHLIRIFPAGLALAEVNKNPELMTENAYQVYTDLRMKINSKTELQLIG